MELLASFCLCFLKKTVRQDGVYGAVTYGQFGSATQVTSIEPLLRLAVQQSNCFVITSIGNQQLDSRLSKITDQQRNSGEYRAAPTSKRASALPLITSWNPRSSSITIR